MLSQLEKLCQQLIVENPTLRTQYNLKVTNGEGASVLQMVLLEEKVEAPRKPEKKYNWQHYQAFSVNNNINTKYLTAEDIRRIYRRPLKIVLAK